MRAWQKTCLPDSSAEMVRGACSTGPFLDHIGNVKIGRDLPGGFFTGIAHGDDLDLRHRLQRRQMFLPHDGAGTDNPDPQLARAFHVLTFASSRRQAR